MMSFTWEQLQAESAAWVTWNFPNRKPHHPLLGLFEEVGELVGAQNSEEEDDALADCMIFAADLCNALCIDLALTVRNAESLGIDYDTNTMLRSIGALSHSVLKMEQGIRGTRDEHMESIQLEITTIVSMLSFYADVNRYTALEDLTEKTWSKVKRRDWRTYPKTGRPPGGTEAA